MRVTESAVSLSVLQDITTSRWCRRSKVPQHTCQDTTVALDVDPSDRFRIHRVSSSKALPGIRQLLQRVLAHTLQERAAGFAATDSSSSVSIIPLQPATRMSLSSNLLRLALLRQAVPGTLCCSGQSRPFRRPLSRTRADLFLKEKWPTAEREGALLLCVRGHDMNSTY